MIDPENRKDQRRRKLQDGNFKRYDISEEQKFVTKSKKQLKKKIEDISSEEKWEDWE